jgi:hypothetical protein
VAALVLVVTATASPVLAQDEPPTTIPPTRERPAYLDVPDEPPVSPGPRTPPSFDVTAPADGAMRPLERPIDPHLVFAYAVVGDAFPLFGCNGDWALLAAIGDVESDHGAAAGPDAMISEGGTVRPRIVGPALDGRAYGAVADTDDGRLDGDLRFDRAVGPMQFLPSTWIGHGVDGSGDGIADPQNVYDAVLSAAGYLCAAAGEGSDLLQEPVAVKAVLAYNRSDSYVRVVLDLADWYRTGVAGVRSRFADRIPLGVAPTEVFEFTEAGEVLLDEDGLPVPVAPDTEGEPDPDAEVVAESAPETAEADTAIAEADTASAEADPAVSTPAP